MVDYQIVILYANLDDKPDSQSSKGWVSILVDNLERLLNRLTAEDKYTCISNPNLDIRMYNIS